MKAEGRYYYALGGHRRKRKSSILKLINGTGDKVEDAATIDGILLTGQRVPVEKIQRANHLLMTYAMDSIGAVEDAPAVVAIRENAKGLQGLFNKASDKSYRPKKGAAPFNALRSLKQNATKGRPSEAFRTLKALRPDLFAENVSKVDRLIDKFFADGPKSLSKVDLKYLRSQTKLDTGKSREHVLTRCPGLIEILDRGRAAKGARDVGQEVFRALQKKLRGGELLSKDDWKKIKSWRAKGSSLYFKLRDDGLIK